MADKHVNASIKPPRRVQILKADKSDGYWKPGQFGYAVAYSTHPGMHTLDKGPTGSGELAYLVSKASHGRGGALWFSNEALRFTKPPAELAGLTDDERVALDLLLEKGHGSSNGRLSTLVPNVERRGQLKATASQLQSLRKR